LSLKDELISQLTQRKENNDKIGNHGRISPKNNNPYNDELTNKKTAPGSNSLRGQTPNPKDLSTTEDLAAGAASIGQGSNQA